MGDIQIKYGTNGQAITITLASLADDALAVSDEISNTSDLFFDILVQFAIKTAAAAVSATGTIIVYAMGSVDAGTSYPDSANYDLKPIGLFNANVNATTFTCPALSVAKAFGGSLPEKFKIVIENQTGAAFDATEGNHAKKYQGILAQSA